MTASTDNVVLIIVLFNPDLVFLENNIQKLKDFSVICVNNTIDKKNNSDINKTIKKYQYASIINNYKNLGLSKALNIGINKSLELNAKKVMLFDQDTLLDVKKIKDHLNMFDSIDDPLMVALGASYVRSKKDKPYFMSYGLFRKRMYQQGSKKIIRIHSAITSGLLIYAPIFRYTGLFDENLFIDYVDIEWSLRIRRMGFHLYGNFNTKFIHTIGDEVLSVLGKKVPIHSIVRFKQLMKDFKYIATQKKYFWFVFHESFQLFLRSALLVFINMIHFLKLKKSNA